LKWSSPRQSSTLWRVLHSARVAVQLDPHVTRRVLIRNTRIPGKKSPPLYKLFV